LHISYPYVSTALLNELRGGEFDGWSRNDIREKRPDVWEAREKDKLNYRWVGGVGGRVDH